jgi:hypothetical protein
VQSTALIDTAGRRRSPATSPAFHQGCPPRNKGLRYQLTRRRSKRSLPSCEPLAITGRDETALADETSPS